MPEFAAPLRPAAKPLNFPRGTLITPSASPPSSRPASPAVRRKSTSRPPPLKRVRTESTHGAATPPTASTSSEPDSAVDNNRDEAWKLSSQRLLDKWAQLADRYNVPLDKDDIIDFRENKLVKDRGVTRRAKKSLLFGELLSEVDASSEDGAADENDDENDNDNDNGPVPREQEAPVKVKLEMEKTNRVLSPFTEMNPADADDLKAFLAEEERRRQTGGIDDLEDDDENSDWVTEYDPEDGSRRRRITVMVGTFDRPPTPEDDSEDEFAKWEADDSTPRPAVPRTPSRPPSSDDIIDLTTPSPPSSPDPPVVRSHTPAKSPIRSFRRRSIEDAVPEAGPSSQKPMGFSRVPARNSQLYTPPLSSQSSSEIGTPSDTHGEHTSQVPRAMSRVSDRPARTNGDTPGSNGVRRATRPRQSSSLSKASYIDAEVTPKLQPKAPRKSTTPAARKRLVAEVVVPRRPKPNKTPSAKLISPERSLFDVEPERPLFTSRDLPGETPPRTPSRRKGKEVRKVVESPLESSDDEPLPPPKPRAKSRPPEAQVSTSSSSPLSQRGHKRKRSPTPPVSSPIRRIRSPSPLHKSASRAKSLPPSSAKAKQSTLKGKGREKPFSDDELGNSPDRSSSTRLPTTRSHAVGSNKQLHPHLATPSFPLPVTPKRHHRNTPQTAAPFPPPLPMQDPQAQYHFAQAVHYLSYLFANGSAPGYVPPLPLPYSQFPTSATPQTPKRRMRAPRREASSSPGTGPSSSPHSIPYSPTHEELYQHHLDAMYSSGTPPPASSSPAPSPPSSPAPRTPGGRGRSKSRGRRVSFKLDPEDRPSFQKGQRAKKAAADAESRFADDQSTRGGKERRTVRGMGCHSDEDDPPMPKPRGERGRTPGPSTRGTSESVGRRR